MTPIRQYFINLFNSTTSLGFYLRLQKTPLSSTLKFLLASTTIYALVSAVFLTTTLLLPLKNLFAVMPEKFAEIYPENLDITVRNGEIITNVETPYYLSLDKVSDLINDLKHQIKGVTTSRPTYLIIIDPEAKSEDFLGLQTFILLTRNNLVFYNDSGHAEIIPLSDFNGLHLNRQIVTQFFHKLTPLFQLIWPLLIFIVTLSLLLLVPIILFSYCLAFSILGYLLSRLIRLELKYSQILQIVIHLSLVSLFLTGILRLLNLSLNLAYLPSVIVILLTFVVLLYLKDQTLETKVTPT